MKKRILICFFTVLLICAAAFISRFEQPKTPAAPEDTLSFSVTADGTTQQVDLWTRDDASYFAFLPSYAQLNTLNIHLNSRQAVYLDGELLTGKSRCGGYEWNTPYAFAVDGWDDQERTLTFVRSGGVNTLFVTTQSGSMDAIHAETGFTHAVKESGSMTLFTQEGRLDYAGTLDSIGGRGFSSWASPKKPYNLKLSKKADLLGMGTAKKWALVANALDFTNLRNKIIYDLADEVGLAGSPDCRLVDLYLNGKYAGLYLLSEKVEIGEERVNISNSDGDITGGYLFTMQLPGRYEVLETAFKTENDQVFEVKGNCNDDQLAYLSQQVQGLENAILSPDGVDSESGKGWLDYIDLDSWVKKYLIEEIFENQDADSASQFFYKDSDSVDARFYAGPVWDYDYTLGNGDLSVHNPNCFIARRAWKKTGVYTPWYGALYAKPEFYDRMVEIYQQDFLPRLNELAQGGIDAMAADIADASAMNRLRWISLYGDTQSADRTAAMRDFLTARIAFLNSAWLEGTDYCTIRLDESDGTEYLYFAVERGQLFEQLPKKKDNEHHIFLGWYDAKTQQSFDATQPITEDVSLFAKWEAVEAEKPATDAPAEKPSDSGEKKSDKTRGDTLRTLFYAAPIAAMMGLMAVFIVIDWRRNGHNGRDED